LLVYSCQIRSHVKGQLTADYDSNSLLGVLLLICHKAKQYLPSPLFLVTIKAIILRLMAATQMSSYGLREVQYLKIAFFIIWKYFWEMV
jgi:hypothetical protein